MRRATVIGSRITGNLANDDGGGVYARRGGVQVYDSVLSNNLVDGSGGAIGSTGDILVVRSQVDGNTTDGDGGALYADEDGDVTVIDSTIDGSDADGPGGAIFTLDGDVAVVRLHAERQPRRRPRRRDLRRGGRTRRQLDHRAQPGRGPRRRRHLGARQPDVVNSTVTDNYAEGQGGGLMAAGTVRCSAPRSAATSRRWPPTSLRGALHLVARSSARGEPSPATPGPPATAAGCTTGVTRAQLHHRRLVRARPPRAT